eukprot:TRINITY_DN107992_c0_g1_i1.p1 TRINITY_DN107992_c0_g1~~TRINITY_DN107992_c0_g1_i1.p1  ORF type:complete len:402 (-),score=60.44 TRINITY_DN107992_c0_g1_i1:283-1488(-)
MCTLDPAANMILRLLFLSLCVETVRGWGRSFTMNYKLPYLNVRKNGKAHLSCQASKHPFSYQQSSQNRSGSLLKVACPISFALCLSAADRQRRNRRSGHDRKALRAFGRLDSTPQKHSHVQPTQPWPALQLPGRRQTVGFAAWATGCLTGLAEPVETRAESQQSSQKMSSTRAQAAEDLVYLGWFAGKWDCTAQFLKAQVGATGESQLDATLPGSVAALKAAAGVIGTDKNFKRASCYWKATSPETNGVSQGFAVEEAGGICAGVVGAGRALAGPDAVTTLLPRQDDPTFLVQGLGSDKCIIANGAFGKPDADGEGSFRVSELFDVEDMAKRGSVKAVIRVVTIYRKASLKKKTSSGSQAYVIEGLQTVTLLAPPKSRDSDPGDTALASWTSLLVYAPLKN